MPEDARCGNCRFWFNSGEPMGECRRYPPERFYYFERDSIHAATGHVDTFSDHWCGEFQPRTEQEDDDV